MTVARRGSRVLPHNLDAEASVLGGVFLRNEVLTQLDTLEAEDFYSPKHRSVFIAMRNLEATAMPIDPVTVDAELRRIGKSESVGGLDALTSLAMLVPSVENVMHYAAEVMDRRHDRLVIERAGNVLDDVYSGATTGLEAVEMLGKWLGSITSRRRDVGRRLGDLAAEELERVESDLARAQSGEEVLLGMPTGFGGIDAETCGYPFGVASLFLGGSGVGKSTAAGQASWAASMLGHAAIVYSFEDTLSFWAQRGLAQESGVATDAIAARRVAGLSLSTLRSARDRWSSRREVVVPAAGWSVDDVLRDAKGRIRRGPPPGCKSIGRIIIVDYLHRVKLRFGRGVDNRTQALGDAMEAFAALAQETESAVVVLGQVKREVELEKRMPEYHECLDSNEPGRIAKFVLGINRPGKYDPGLNPLRGEVRVLKRSQGEAGIVDEVVFDLKTHTITSVTDTRDSGAQRSLVV